MQCLAPRRDSSRGGQACLLVLVSELHRSGACPGGASSTARLERLWQSSAFRKACPHPVLCSTSGHVLFGRWWCLSLMFFLPDPSVALDAWKSVSAVFKGEQAFLALSTSLTLSEFSPAMFLCGGLPSVRPTPSSVLWYRPEMPLPELCCRHLGIHSTVPDGEGETVFRPRQTAAPRGELKNPRGQK